MTASEVRPPPDQYLEWLQAYSQSIQDLCLAARAFAVERAPDATEIIADGTNAVALGLTYTHTHVKGFIYIAACSDHVNFGFNYGASFADPELRLVGNGNQTRHMKLWTLTDLDDPYLAEMFEQAHSKAFRPEPPLERQTLFMLYENAKKRRPAGGN